MGLSSPVPKVQHASPAPGISTMSDSAPDQPAQTPDAAGDAAAGPTPKVLAVTCVFAAVVGVVVSLAAWCFLELVHQIQNGVFNDLPGDMGYHSAPWWWLLIVLAVAGLVVALAVERLPGRGGHVPAHGLQVGGTPMQPIDLPGVILAALASVGLGTVVGPEAPLLALGAGLGLLLIRRARPTTPQQGQALIAAAGSFAAISFLFDQPIIAAVLVIEATGLAKKQLPLVLLPGLAAAGIGSLVTIGMGKLTGLSTSAYSLSAVPLPTEARPTLVDFAWTIPLAIVVAIGAVVIFRLARAAEPHIVPRLLVLAPAVGMIVAGLAIAFAHITGKSYSEVLFSGQDQLPGLVSGASGWSASALLLVLGFKGLAYSLSLPSFRGGPTFPAMFLGAAAGILMARLPGFQLTAAVGVGMGASLAAVLRLPLSAVVIATLLTDRSGPGAGPVIIVGVVIAYLVAIALDRRQASKAGSPHDTEPASATGASGAAQTAVGGT
jgi:H+/Cl- antiporter ClcA